MTYKELANSVLEYVGGPENIISAANCMTRLRFFVRNDDAVREDSLLNLEDVLHVNHTQKGYVEVVVGPGKSSKCMQVLKARGIPTARSTKDALVRQPDSPSDGEKLSGIKEVLKTFGNIFAPLIPGIIAAGLCAGFAALISQLVPGYKDSRFLTIVYTMLTGIETAFMTYLTAWTGYRTAEVLGGTPILGGMIGMFCGLDSIDTIAIAAGLYNEAQPLNAILRSGRGGVLAAVIGVWLMCRVEPAIRKRMPDAFDTVFTPLLTLILVLVPYTFIVMPATGLISMGLCKAIGAVAMNSNPFVRMLAGFLGAALFLPMVATGMHHGLIALYTVQLETFGYVTLYPALAMAGAGQVGAAIALALSAKKTGNTRLLHIIRGALPAGILGVGEPLIYGVTLPLGKPFFTAGIGAGFGGAFVMLMEVASTIWGPSGLLGVFVMTEGPKGAKSSMLCYLIGLAISAVAAFLITALSIREDAVQPPESVEPLEKPMPVVIRCAKGELRQPCRGEVIARKDIPDDTFAEGVLGDGIGVKPADGEVLAPFDGTVTSVFDTKHAVTLEKDGMEVLIHIGINTVKLNGKGFESYVRQGDAVKTGQKLLSFDRETILKAGYNDTVVMLLTNSDDLEGVVCGIGK